MQSPSKEERASRRKKQAAIFSAISAQLRAYYRRLQELLPRREMLIGSQEKLAERTTSTEQALARTVESYVSPHNWNLGAAKKPVPGACRQN
jgi:hypothetical protein